MVLAGCVHDAGPSADPEPSGGDAPMRLFKRRSQQKAELPCPRCTTLVPVGDDVCNVCGWDMLDQYKRPAPVPAPAGEEGRAAS